MIGIIDVGVGLRGIYGTGVLDFRLDNNINFDYGIGVSAGSANIASYFGKQKGRNLKFYSEYIFRKEYMSLHNLFRNGSYIDLDYVYSGLSDPLPIKKTLRYIYSILSLMFLLFSYYIKSAVVNLITFEISPNDIST
ncbi:patatin-like phospholipase family protein [Clostridioides difficile]